MNQNSKNEFIQKLRAVRAPLRPSFKSELKQHFVTEVKVPQRPLFFNFQNMKRLSFVSIGLLVLIASLLSIFPSRSLSSQEILAKAAEVYTGNVGIYYEKRTDIADAKGGDTVYEKWSDPTGNYMSIQSNGLTGEIIDGFLYKKSPSGGELYVHHDDEITKNSTGANIFLSEDGERIADIIHHDENIVWCRVSEKTDQSYKSTGIKIDKLHPEVFDPAVWDAPKWEVEFYDTTEIMDAFADTFTGEREHLSSRIDDLSEMTHTSNELRKYSSLKIIEQLKENPSLTYQELNEDGKDYYVFKLIYENGYENSEEDLYYIDSETYQLSKEEIYENDIKVYTSIYEADILDPSEEASIYDPSKYQLTGGYEVAGIATQPLYPESGCYNDLEQKLSKDQTLTLLNSIKGIPEAIQKILLQ